MTNILIYLLCTCIL